MKAFFKVVPFTCCLVFMNCSINAQSLKELVKFMSGSFNSYQQAQVDTDYFDVSLEMKPIWKKDKKTKWLYVEQAITKNKNNPYRQRVYGITQTAENEFVSTVYLIPNQATYVGAYHKAKKRFKNLSSQQLEEKEGCHITLIFDGTTYKGKTGETGCPSKLRGSTYATSEVIIGKNKLESWDRGFDQKGKQVWGAEKGAYIFDKQ